MKMKKFLMFLCAVMLVFGMVGTASAISFTDTQTLNVTIGEGPIAQLWWGDSYTYSHATPADFEVPWDVVNSATLKISGYWIDDNNDTVAISGSVVGTLTSGGSYSWSSWQWLSWDTPSISFFDIASTFSSWTTGEPFDVTIIADGYCFDGIIQIASSIFTLDYDNASAPVPEPSTILLMGVGLLGLVGFSRKRLNKKS
ncbi:MAG: PEP-CTERM sorting domain-containing protein [Deltaproteobacteria bacterium]|nr:PEP-CTERM sorting domain-containing protein [Deltaproteobacteria bacterium]